MDRKEAAERIQEVMTIIRTQHMCKDMDGECTTEDRETYIQRFEALRIAIEALQEKERKKERCEYCKDGKSFIGQVVILGNDSTCHKINYCPNCGAEMRKGKEE